MNITIRIIYKGYTSRIMRGASFPVNIRKFKEDPDQEAARVAYEWMKDIRREAHVSEIIEVMYNDDKDITGLVKGLDKAPLK